MIYVKQENDCKTLDVLQSCMYLSDKEELEKLILNTNYNTGGVIVNQIEYTRPESETVLTYDFGNIRIINSYSRGVSLSRNIALRKSNADVCVICDDDEYLYEGYEKEIIRIHNENKDYDIIAFSLDYGDKQFGTRFKQINLFNSLKINSVQLTFKRENIIAKKLCFDEKMGSGSGNGAGEENKFLADAIRANLKICYIPIKIARINDSGISRWNKDYNNQYFINRGWSIRRILGIWGVSYIVYFSVFKYKYYRNTCGFLKSLRLQLKGYFSEK